MQYENHYSIDFSVTWYAYVGCHSFYVFHSVTVELLGLRLSDKVLDICFGSSRKPAFEVSRFEINISTPRCKILSRQEF